MSAGAQSQATTSEPVVSKKQRRRPGGAEGKPAPSGPERQPEQEASRTLAEVEGVIERLTCEARWSDLLTFSTLELDRIVPQDQEQSRVALLRARVKALCPQPHEHPMYKLEREERRQLVAALTQLRPLLTNFHACPEFHFYVHGLGHSAAESVEAFRGLTDACLAEVNFERLELLRMRALHVYGHRNGDLETSEDERPLYESITSPLGILGDALALAEQGIDSLSELQALHVRLMRLDLDMRLADPWDYAAISQRLQSLPEPAYEWDDTLVDGPLTPRSWAFLWELGNVSSSGFSELAQRFSQPLLDAAVEGLRQLLQSVVNPDSMSRDHYLSEAVQLLGYHLNKAGGMLGRTMLLQTSTGPQELVFAGSGPYFADLDVLLLRLVEPMLDSSPRSGDLRALYEVFSTHNGDNYARLTLKDVGWLCEQSVQFQLAAAGNMPARADRMQLLLESIARFAECSAEAPFPYFPASLEDDDPLTVSEAARVLDALEKVAQLRERLEGDSLELLLDDIIVVFDALSRVEDAGVRKRALGCAQALEDDLADKGQFFRLAYLEHVAGDPERALAFYVRELESENASVDAIAGNVKVLWNRFDSTGQIDRALGTLAGGQETSKYPQALADALKGGHARRKELLHEEQFEKTAVNRWPALTPPARKLLLALNTITSYHGMKQLAEYSGVDERWVEHHYDKLLEVGMIFKTAGGYRINRFIKPLLEQEAQHGVARRIIRVQGTSAVKPVFNSNREFGIYEVMVQLCPNQLVFPNCSLQTIMAFDRMKELVEQDDFGYYLRASVDLVVVSSTTYLPMFAIEVDSVWHDTDKQQERDDRKDRLFAAAGIPFMRLRPVGSPTQNTIRGLVGEHLDELVRTLRADMPGYEQARGLLIDLSTATSPEQGRPAPPALAS
jgi:hypothetical protein